MGKIDLHSIIGFVGSSPMARFNWGGGLAGAFGGYGPAGIEGGSMTAMMHPGDPHSFDGSAIRFGFDRLVDAYSEELSQTGLAGDALHEEATRRALVTFNTVRIPIFVDWAISEKNGHVKPAAWVIVETTDGKKDLISSQTGEEWDQIWNNAREFQVKNPTFRYDPAEHQAHREIKGHIVSGAQSVVYFMNDMAGQRYAVQLVRQGNRVVSESIDVSATIGRDLTPEETLPVLERLFQKNKDAEGKMVKNPSQPYVVLQKRPMDTRQIHATVAETIRPHRQDQPTSVESPRRMPNEAPRQNVGELKRIALSDVRASGERQPEKERASVPIRNNIVLDASNTIVSAGKATVIDTLTSVITLGSFLRRERQQKKPVAAVAAVTAETRVGVHAAPLLLARIAEAAHPSITAVEKSVRRHEKKVRKVQKAPFGRTQGKREVREARRIEGKIERKNRKKRKVYLRHAAAEKLSMRVREKRRHPRKRKRTVEIGVKKVAAARKITPMVLEKQERKEKRRLRRIMKKAERVLEAKRVPKRLALQESVLRSRKEREAVEGVGFGWILWMLLTQRYDRKSKDIVTVPPAVSVGERFERLIFSEETAWILLSIIWYLTMLREGVGRNQFAQPYKNPAPTFAQYAVIFAYAS